MPVLGLGTWRMGESRGAREREIDAVVSALRMGYRLIDTAEMYGEGGAEKVVGSAIARALGAGELRREELFIVSKVYPHNAGKRSLPQACARSLERLGLDRIDLYLLHWRGDVPLRETVEALRALVREGRIARWGVSNFDVDDLADLDAACGPDRDCAVNQVWYSLGERGPEHALMRAMAARGMPLMAYSPIDQGRRGDDALLGALGAPRGLTAAQVALAWVLSRPGVVAIPKAVQAVHLSANLAAVDVVLEPEVRARLDDAYPPPRGPATLAMN